MLKIYQKLFADLDKAGVSYSAFKSLEHLEADLNGDRGDIDIWFDRKNNQKAVEIAVDNGFFKVRWAVPSRPAFIMAGWDIETGKKALLHIHHNPIAIKKRSFVPLYFTYDLLPKPEKNSKNPKQPSSKWVEKFEADRKQLKAKNDFWLMGKILTGSKFIRKVNFKFSLSNTLLIYPTYIRRFVFARGHYPVVKKGLFIAFVGVDGSGKSTAVESLSGSDFLATTQGISSKYFGNNDFWMPGLNKAFSQVKGLSLKSFFVLGFSVVDRKLRVIPAYGSKLRGKVVICDRYFYDQNIADPTEKYLKNRLIKAVLNPFIQWMPVKPDITFYMRVSPKTAYGRKQDYEYEKVERMCAAYDALLKTRPEVIVIDAEQPLEKVLSTIRQEVVNRLNLMRY